MSLTWLPSSVWLRKDGKDIGTFNPLEMPRAGDCVVISDDEVFRVLYVQWALNGAHFGAVQVHTPTVVVEDFSKRRAQSQEMTDAAGS